MTVGLIGDSTVAVQSGWGPAFAERFDSRAKIVNCAKNGATLQALSKKLDDLVQLKPDYVLIQFGHNDQKRYDTTIYSDHLRSLRGTHKEVWRQGGDCEFGHPSQLRRSREDRVQLGQKTKSTITRGRYVTDYANAAKVVAGELNLPFIDLHGASIATTTRSAAEESMTYNFKEGDKTHFNKKGAEAITDLILEELKSVVPELAPYLKVAAPQSSRPPDLSSQNPPASNASLVRTPTSCLKPF